MWVRMRFLSGVFALFIAFLRDFRAFRWIWSDFGRLKSGSNVVILGAGGAGRVRIGMGSRQKHFRGGVG